MATQGKNAAYQQLTAPQDNISTDLQYWNDDAFKKKQEERITENSRLTREDAQNKARQARLEKYAGSVKNYDTGNSSLTEMQGRGLMDAVDMMGDLLDVTAPENEGKYGTEERVRAQVKLSNLSKAAQSMKAVTDKWYDRHSEILKGIESGTIKDNAKTQEYLDFVKSGFEKAQITFDEMGMPLIAYRDKDGDGIKDVETYEEIMSNQSPFKFDRNVDPIAIADQIIADPKVKFKSQSDENYLKRETTGYDPEKIEYASRYAIVDPNGEITDLGESMLVDMGLQDSAENREKVYAKFKEIIDNRIPEDQIVDTRNYAAQNAASKLAFDRQKEANKDKPSQRAAEIEIDTDSSGRPLSITPPGGGSGDIFSFSPSTPISAGTKENPVQIHKLYMDKDGRLSYSGSEQTGTETIKDGDRTIKQAVYEPVNRSPLDGDKLNSLARLINDPETGEPFKNQGELVDFLKGKLSESRSEDAPKKLTIKASDISAKASAAGYTEAEYRKLLEDRGVTIE